jgi:SEL1 protein
MALETNTEAYLPVVLSLIKLHIKSIWHALSGGSQREKLLIWGEESEGGEGWYLGKSKAEMKRKRAERAAAGGAGGEAGGAGGEGGEGLPEGEDVDIVEWARRKKDEEAANNDGDYGPEDYFDAATRRRHMGENGDEEDDDLETIVCLSFHLALAGKEEH